MEPVSKSSTSEGLPIAPSLEPSLVAAHIPRQTTLVNQRVVQITAVAILIALVAGVVAQVLAHLINLITNLAFYGRLALTPASPAGNQLGILVLFVPVVGGILVGIMARYGSKAIRGHGIPEAMEQVLMNQSRIPARLAFLKPISAAIAIGTGGPFGAEGPIIATGGALGSVVGQLLKTTADERKILLSAGAAAGMSATFGSPVSAVLLAIELLLFEFRPRSFIPVALASVTAAAVRMGFVGSAPAFGMPDLTQPSGGAIASYILLGALIGVASVYITRAVYGIEDAFEYLPIHWMWWPAIGGIAVGIVGYAVPRTLGIGYENIEQILSGKITGLALVILFTFKFISWAVSLGSGTSGGTLAPLFTIGGGLGAAIGGATVLLFPHLGVDVRIAALVGMAAIFAGASRALLASVIFAFETTLQPLGLLPLLGGCTAAYLVSSLLMKHTIMTEKIARRGIQVLTEYSIDSLAQTLVRDSASYPAVSLKANMTLEQVRSWIATDQPESRHQGFPVLDATDRLTGIVTRRDLLDPKLPPSTELKALIKRPPAVVYEDHTLREAADLMVGEEIGRLPVVTRSHPPKVVAMLTRSDLLLAHRKRLDEAHQMQQSIRWGKDPSASKS